MLSPDAQTDEVVTAIKALATDADYVATNAELATSASDKGELTPEHLTAVRESAQALAKNLRGLIGEPESGTPAGAEEAPTEEPATEGS